MKTTRRLNQKAVYWANSGELDDFGEPTLNAGVEINVRWEEKRGELLNANDDRIATEVNVVVDREIAIGSILWKGLLEDHVTGTSTGYKQVVAYNEIPDIKARNYRRVVTLAKHSDRLPTLA